MERFYLVNFGLRSLNRYCQAQVSVVSCRFYHTTKSQQQLPSRASRDPIFFESAGLRLQLRIDYFKGVHVDLASLPKETSTEQTSKFLTALEHQCRDKKQTVMWVRVPIELSSVASSLGHLGFIYHHALDRHSVLYKWLRDDTDRVPKFATHRVSVAGLVFHQPPTVDTSPRASPKRSLLDTAQILFVREKTSNYRGWKFPGGMLNFDEEIGAAAEREVFEETGVRTKFESVLGFRQLPSVRVASGVSDLHILCRLRTEQSPSPSPSPSQATKTPEGGTGISGGGGAEPPALQPCPVEIAEARWASLRAVADELHRARTQPASEKIFSPLTSMFLTLIRKGLEEGFETIEWQPRDVPALMPGRVIPASFFMSPQVPSWE